MKPKPLPEGWEWVAKRCYRYPLPDRQMLMVVQFSPLKWYWGHGKLWAKRGWKAMGKECNRERAMAKAMALIENHGKEMGDGAADTRADDADESLAGGAREPD